LLNDEQKNPFTLRIGIDSSSFVGSGKHPDMYMHHTFEEAERNIN
jgi:hypothetical protein